MGRALETFRRGTELRAHGDEYEPSANCTQHIRFHTLRSVRRGIHVNMRTYEGKPEPRVVVIEDEDDVRMLHDIAR
ncbi:hypothetical protein HYS30_00390, partial [Candidatus Peregrinibacteria bacterium]|nr:hypothetical protein [Candidatus Peregrinibacteria bacterium]